MDLAQRISNGAVAALDLVPLDERFDDLSRRVLQGGATRFAAVVNPAEDIDYVIPVGVPQETVNFGALVVQASRVGLLWREGADERHLLVALDEDTRATWTPAVLGGEVWTRFDLDDHHTQLSVLTPPTGSSLLRDTLIQRFHAADAAPPDAEHTSVMPIIDADRVASESDPAGRVASESDPAGRVASESDDAGRVPSEASVSRPEDDAGRVATEERASVSRPTDAPDDADRVPSESDPAGRVASEASVSRPEDAPHPDAPDDAGRVASEASVSRPADAPDDAGRVASEASVSRPQDAPHPDAAGAAGLGVAGVGAAGLLGAAGPGSDAVGATNTMGGRAARPDGTPIGDSWDQDADETLILDLHADADDITETDAEAVPALDSDEAAEAATQALDAESTQALDAEPTQALDAEPTQALDAEATEVWALDHDAEAVSPATPEPAEPEKPMATPAAPETPTPSPAALEPAEPEPPMTPTAQPIRSEAPTAVLPTAIPGVEATTPIPAPALTPERGPAPIPRPQQGPSPFQEPRNVPQWEQSRGEPLYRDAPRETGSLPPVSGAPASGPTGAGALGSAGAATYGAATSGGSPTAAQGSPSARDRGVPSQPVSPWPSATPQATPAWTGNAPAQPIWSSGTPAPAAAQAYPTPARQGGSQTLAGFLIGLIITLFVGGLALVALLLLG